MLHRLRDTWRRARGLRAIRPIVASLDRAWWARTIRLADVVDLPYVRAQGGPRSRRRAVRAYVRGGFRDGLSLNPLFMERLVSSQLPEAGRVPALYAYLVGDVRAVEVSTSWDAIAYASRTPESLRAPGGPLGHAWRAARTEGSITLGTGARAIPVSWAAVEEHALRAARASRGGVAFPRLGQTHTDLVFQCRLAPDEGIPARPLQAALDLAAGGGVTTIIAVDGSSVESWTGAALTGLWLDRVWVVRDEEGLAGRVADAADPQATLLVRGPHADISASDLRALAALGAEEPTAPLWLGWDGSVASAGVTVRNGRRAHLLRGHPAEDARALGPFVETVEPAGNTYARPVRGVLRGRTALDLVVRAPDAPPPSTTVEIEDTDVDALLAPLGFRVRSWDGADPRLHRARRYATLPDGSVVPAFRWALKIAAPPGAPGEAWGDTHFARGLADALRELGQEVVIDAYAARERESKYLDDVVVALRGPEPIDPQPGALSLLWIISHPDEIHAADVTGFARVFAASSTWAAEASSAFGFHIEPLLQCTDTRRFRPQGLPRTAELVFVGTARGIARPSVVGPIRAGIDVSVYGPDWRGYIPAASIVATGIPNSELPALYEAAGAVLNDHWPAMKRHGFVSNRLFDVVAAGGRAMSDEVSGIDEIFSGAVATYSSVADLISTLSGDLDSAFPSEASLADISRRIRADHSFDARARTLLRAAIEADQTAG